MTFAYNILKWFDKKKDTAKYYFECHITIEPVFGYDRELVESIAESYGFKLAKLLMQKRKEDTEERSKNDTFMTSHSKSLNDIETRMIHCIEELQMFEFKIWRYKIEDIVMDSRNEDILNLIDKKD